MDRWRPVAVERSRVVAPVWCGFLEDLQAPIPPHGGVQGDWLYQHGRPILSRLCLLLIWDCRNFNNYSKQMNQRSFKSTQITKQKLREILALSGLQGVEDDFEDDSIVGRLLQSA